MFSVLEQGQGDKQRIFICNVREYITTIPQHEPNWYPNKNQKILSFQPLNLDSVTQVQLFVNWVDLQSTFHQKKILFKCSVCICMIYQNF